MTGYIGDNKKDYITRLRRAEGQAKGLQGMVDREAPCVEILTQVSAVTKALQVVARSLAEDYVSRCLADVANANDADRAAAKLKEATDIVTRLLR